MRSKLIASLAILFAVFFGGTNTAEAGKVPIPCTGEKIVRVAELPTRVDAGNGKALGLGYLYTGCFSGRWIGHIGSDNQYSDKVGPLLMAAMTQANNGVSPTEPGLFWGLWNYPGQFIAEWIWLVMFGCLAVAIPFRRERKQPESTVAASRLEAVAQAAAAKPAEAAAQAAPPPARRRAPRNLPVGLNGAQQAAFGKRA